MREEIKKLMEFINTTVDKNAKCNLDTLMEVKYTFFGGKASMKMSASNIEFYDDGFQFVSDLEDLSDFCLYVKVTDEIEIQMDRKTKTFVITNVGVTGIMNKKIEGRMIQEERI